jgi:hypothetical protein
MVDVLPVSAIPMPVKGISITNKYRKKLNEKINKSLLSLFNFGKKFFLITFITIYPKAIMKVRIPKIL